MGRKHSFYMLILQVGCLLLAIVDITSGVTSELEILDLERLYNSTNGAGWSWRPEEIAGLRWRFGGNCSTRYDASCDPCDGGWQGVECVYEPPLGPAPDCGGGPSRNVPIIDDPLRVLCINSTVTSLRLVDMSMYGTFPTQFSNLGNLASLNFTKNFIYGSLPSSLFSLSSLRNLSLSQNDIRGPFPSLGSLTNLEILHMYINNLRGPIPEDIGNYTSLREVNIAFNQLDSTLPSSVGNLQSLEGLFIMYNSLEGKLPDAISNCSSLLYLNLLLNDLSSSIPSSLGKLTKLRFLSLRANTFTGTIPSELGRLTNLEHFVVGRNCLHGLFPIVATNFTKLVNFGIGFNNFHGPLPQEILRWSQLQQFSIEMNLFTGTVPPFIASLSSLEAVYMDNNLFYGQLPSFISAWTRIEEIDFDSNSFSGSIPTSWASLTSLKILDISSNNIGGSIPTELLSLHKLEILEVDGNYLGGEIPGNLSLSFPNMEYADFGNNYFVGHIPSSMWEMSTLKVLYMNVNYLSGQFADDLSDLPYLSYLHLGQNELTGSIPDSVGSLSSLIELYLYENKIGGAIPASIGSVKPLNTLSLSSNCLSGSIPSTIKELQYLSTIVLQKNQLTGSVDGVFGPKNINIFLIDISDNALTGTLPSNLFNHSRLKRVTASLNCFSGSIPDSICKAIKLEQLVLDGLTTGKHCQSSTSLLFGAINLRVLSEKISGALPDCLFNMSRIETIRASGNGIEGTLPEIQNAPKLVDIKLAWNNIEGTIPESYGRRVFRALDLSVNKITGTCDHIRIDGTHPNSSLGLRSNRLSGPISETFLHLPNINILDGNMFECSVSRDELPSNDANYAEYSCGSNSVNVTLFVWMVGLLFFVICSAIYWWRRYSEKAEMHNPSVGSSSRLSRAIGLSKDFLGFSNGDFIDVHPELPVFFPRVAYFHRMYSHMRRLVVAVTGAVVLVFLPVYLIMHNSASSSGSWTEIYSDEYVWSASGLWSSGTGFFGVMFVMWTLVVVLVTVLMYPEVRLQLKSRFEALQMALASKGTQKGSKASVAKEIDDRNIPVDVFHRHSVSVNSQSSNSLPPNYKWRSWNLVLTEWLLFLVNLIVVVAVNAGFIRGMQSNVDVSVKSFLPVALALFTIFWGRFLDICILLIFQGSENSPYRLYFGIMVFNTIVAPCLSGLFIDSNCLLYVIENPESIATETNTYVCSDWSNFDGYNFCSRYTDTLFKTSFIPLYSYHDTCSHSIFSRFMPSLIIYYFVNCVIVPLIKYLLFFRSSESIIDSLYNSLPSWCRDLVPKYLLSPEVNEQSYNKFPSARMLATSHVNLTVLLTFGLVFPPLAVIIALLVLVQSWLHLEMITASLNAWYEHRVNGITSSGDRLDAKIGSWKANEGGVSIDEVTMTKNPVHSAQYADSARVKSESRTEFGLQASSTNHTKPSSASSSTATVRPSSASSAPVLSSSASRSFDVDPTVLDIYLSADCTGYVSCSVWMFLTSALFYTILLSDMVSDEVGFRAAQSYWCLCFVVLVVVLCVYVWLLHEYMSRPVAVAEAEAELKIDAEGNYEGVGLGSCCGTGGGGGRLASWYSSLRGAMGFVWDLCFGDGEVPGDTDAAKSAAIFNAEPKSERSVSSFAKRSVDQGEPIPRGSSVRTRQDLDLDDL